MPEWKQTSFAVYIPSAWAPPIPSEFVQLSQRLTPSKFVYVLRIFFFSFLHTFEKLQLFTHAFLTLGELQDNINAHIGSNF